MSAAIAATVGGSLISGLMGSDASSDAAAAQEQAAQQASQTQLQMFNQIQQNLQPYMTTGGYGNSLLAAFLGVPYQPQTESQIRNSLAPQYTNNSSTASVPAVTSTPSSTTSSGNGNPYAPNTTAWKLWNYENTPVNQRGNMQGSIGGDQDLGVYNWANPSNGYGQNMVQPAATTPTSNVDTAGLDAAVKNVLAQQNALSGVASSIQGMGLQPFVYNEATDPMAQTMLKFGSDAISNQRSALGGVNSGATLKALSDYGQQTAASSYQQEYNNYYNNLNRIFDMLSGVSSSGQNAAAGVGNAGLSTGNSIASNTLAAGNAQSAGIIGGANAYSNGLQSLFNSPSWINAIGGTGGVPSSALAAANASSDPIGSLISSLGG